MITGEEKVKILDFGLAKALADEIQSVDSSQSPTITEAMTQPGVVLGTAAYMSPEQAKGKVVDKGADITDIYGYLSWYENDSILYAGENIMRISANGGNPELLVEGKGKSIIAPQILPDGKTVMFTMPPKPMKIMLHSLETGGEKELIEGDTARYLPTGHIVYAKDNNLFAVPFDLGSLQTEGSPISMIVGIMQTSGAPQYAVSDSGTLIYLEQQNRRLYPRTLVWIDRQGKEDPVDAAANAYGQLSLSPDGTKVALTISSGNTPNTTSDIWIY